MDVERETVEYLFHGYWFKMPERGLVGAAGGSVKEDGSAPDFSFSMYEEGSFGKGCGWTEGATGTPVGLSLANMRFLGTIYPSGRFTKDR